MRATELSSNDAKSPIPWGKRIGDSVPLVLFWTGGILFIVLLADSDRPWEDAILLSLLVSTTGGRGHSLALVSAIVLNWASEPPLEWPTYWVSLVPLVLAWRQSRGRWGWLWESFLVGCMLCWFGTPFIRDSLPSNSLIAHLFGCFEFGLQWVGIAWALRVTRSLPLVPGAAIAALLATGCEVLQAVYGLPWVFMALALPLAPTPAAQWARWITPFGVSLLLYFINFIWLPDPRRIGLIRWAPATLGALLAAGLWLGGQIIISLGSVHPLSFSVLMVEPDGRRDADAAIPATSRSNRLRSMTRTALDEDSDVDLIVWPESSRAPIRWPDWGDQGHQIDMSSRAGAQGIAAHVVANRPTVDMEPFGNYENTFNEFGVPTLFGAPVSTNNGRRFNSACLASRDGNLSRHDKLQLTWLVERLPPVVDPRWFRNYVLPFFGTGAHFEPGEHYELLTFTTRNGRTVYLDVSVCYEMYFPWLPQYREQSDAEAIVHLTNEDWARRGDAKLARYEVWACQYRAIETRRWQLLCTTCGYSAVINPYGVVRDSLARDQGVLRVCSNYH